MNFSILRPPNDRFLSDAIIGDVVQRRGSKRYFHVNDNSHTEAVPSWRPPRHSYQQQPRIYERSRIQQVQRTNSDNTRLVITEGDAMAVLGLLSLTKRTRVESPHFSSHKSRAVVLETTISQAKTDTESLNSEKQEPVLSTPQEPQKHLIRREMITQYRKKQDERISHLEKKTQQLHEEIDRFELQRRAMATALPANQNGWDVALEYFKLFRFGLQTKGRSSTLKTDAQLDFLKKTMTSGVVVNTGQGPDALLRSWKCISLWFQDVGVELEGLDRGAAGSLVAITRTKITITERTLLNVFPHLCNSNGGRSKLADRLLGQRIVMRGLTRFEWNSAVGRFTSVVAHSDLLAPMLNLLDSVEDVSRVFERSSISPDFQWRSKV